MSRSRLIILGLVGAAFGLGVIAGVAGILYATGRLTPESRDIQDAAPTLSLDTATPTVSVEQQATQIAEINANLNAIATQVGESDTLLGQQINALEAAIANVQAAPAATPLAGSSEPAVTEAESPEPTPEETVADTAEVNAPSGDVPVRAIYRITQDESEVRFMIDEILFGNANTVVATTRRVAGDVIVNFSDPPASQVGTIAINARTFRTDNSFRDQAIRGQILESASDDYEFINFVPTELEGLPSEPVGVGSTVEFQVIGDLTIKEVTRSLTFDVTVDVVAEGRIEGLATTTVLYDDFGLTINAPPGVEGIGDTVTLEIDFVALLVEGE